MATIKKRVETLKVSPTLAKKWLATNHDNRPIRNYLVTAMAFDMSNDEWDDNGETIKFDENGELIDGQHRLLAVVEAKKTVEMLVVWGLKRKSQDTIDTGAKRTFADNLIRRKEKNAFALAAIVRKVALWENGLTLGRKHVISNHGLDRILTKYPNLREAAREATVVAQRSSLIASVAGYCWWAFSQVDEKDCKYFFDRLGDLHNATKGNPIDALKLKLQKIKSRDYESVSEIWLAAVTIKAWNKFRTGETWEVVDFKTGGAKPEPPPTIHGWKKNSKASMDAEQTPR